MQHMKSYFSYRPDVSLLDDPKLYASPDAWVHTGFVAGCANLETIAPTFFLFCVDNL